MTVMIERNVALRAKHAGSNRWFQSADGALRRFGVLALLCGGLMVGAASQAGAEPAGVPTKDEIFYNCTFTAAGLESALNIDTSNLNVPDEIEAIGHLRASYIIIYVRQTPNDGQEIGTVGSGDFTGPVLCTNSEEDDINQTNEGAAIGSTLAPINIVGAEEASHLQVEPASSVDPTHDDRTKRVCHTVASKTECFLITKLP
jgi:hypothetical protein